MEAPMFTIDRSTSSSATPLVDHVLRLVDASRPTRVDARVWTRVRILTLGSLIALGRHTLTQLLVAIGAGDLDWSAWYRTFNRDRFQLDRGRLVILREVLRSCGADAPLVVVVDATQAPRSSRRFPGVGATRAPRCPVWRPGVHLAQRIEIVSGLMARTETGESRAVPLQATVLRTSRTQPFETVPEQTEAEGATRLLARVRDDLAVLGEPDRRLLVLGDGAYSTAPVLRNLPERTGLLARCAKNRALFARPVQVPGHRGRRRLYGERGPTPQEQVTGPGPWRTVSFAVRGRRVTPRVCVTGPWLVKPVPDHPLFLIVVKGVKRGRGLTRRQRASHFFLVSAASDDTGTPVLPLPVTELLAWAWQRWEVEVMHRELKSSCGFGDQQAWSSLGAARTLEWTLWTYALLILTGVAVWGLGPAPGPDPGRWWRPRRWSVGRLLQAIRAELWQVVDLSPGWRRTPDAWAEMETWITTRTSAALGIRHI